MRGFTVVMVGGLRGMGGRRRCGEKLECAVIGGDEPQCCNQNKNYCAIPHLMSGTIVHIANEYQLSLSCGKSRGELSNDHG